MQSRWSTTLSPSVLTWVPQSYQFHQLLITYKAFSKKAEGLQEISTFILIILVLSFLWAEVVNPIIIYRFRRGERWDKSTVK